jgi:hypothetical protein
MRQSACEKSCLTRQVPGSLYYRVPSDAPSGTRTAVRVGGGRPSGFGAEPPLPSRLIEPHKALASLTGARFLSSPSSA